MASQNLLRQLHRLDKSSSRFHDQLCNALYREEYKQAMPDLQGDDLAELVDYLDEVRCCVTLSHLCSSQHRFSMFSILPIPVSGNVSANSENYVEPG